MYIRGVSKQDNDAHDLLPLPAVAFHILVVLADGERHGYGIIQDVLAHTDGAMRIQPGTLYRFASSACSSRA